MSANDYVAMVAKANPALFIADKTVKLKSSELRKQLQLAFEAGKVAGKEGQSVFERIFG